MAERRDELTPMMEQYFELCDEYDDCVVLFQVGDFYETFCDAARDVSRKLDITLTQREDSSGTYPMAGIPVDAAESYVETLLDEGYRVAVADQVQDPDETTGVVRRAVTRVVTPGTVVEDELLNEDNNYVACVVEGDDEEEDDGVYGVAFMDVSTGELVATTCGADDLRDEIDRFAPSEAVTHDGSFFDGDCMVTPYDAFAPDEPRAVVEAYFGNADTLLDGDTEVRACGTLLAYAEYTRGEEREDEEREDDRLGYVNRLRRYDPRDHMLLDTVALESLEVFESRRGDETLFGVLDETSCALGSRKLKSWLRHPLLDADDIDARLDAVGELKKQTLVREEVRELLRDVYDIERLVTRVSRGRANARDLLALKNTLDIVPRVEDALTGVESPRLVSLRESLDTMDETRGLIGRAVREDPPIEITEGDVIREGFDDELDELRRVENEGREWVASLEESERERTGIDSLKVGFNNVHGYYIEVTNPNLDDVPDDYMRRQTLKNSERFYTPELKEREDEILSAEERADKLEYRLFKDVRDEVAEEAERMQDLAETLATLDALCALAAVAAENGYARPEFVGDDTDDGGEGGHRVEGARHPVVERSVSEYVPNDASFDDAEFAVVTGPNMSGKSTYMRSVALVSVLAQVGSFVPAEEARLEVVDRVFTRVGASDDIAGGRSTFMVEMVELAEILHNATERSLVLLDEVGRGTSTADGLSIARAVTEFVHDEIGAKTMFATHYHELTETADKLEGVRNLHFAADRRDGDMVFLHEVVEGAASESYGVEVARMAGVPSDVVERAEELVEGGFGASDGNADAPVADEPKQATLDAGIVGDDVDERTNGEKTTDGVTADILDELADVDTANTTPIEALNVLNRLSKRAEEKDLR
ncbi:MAG: DNA mismatch repair protein MutS [Halobacteriales archaeon]|nr:DNA mismatch repair protein MutS [Halobacteriales archaeon]